MKLTMSHYEYTRSGERLEVEDGSFTVPKTIEIALSLLAREYRTSRAGMLQIVLAYYFGDGANHLGCSDCKFFCLDASQDAPGPCGGCEPGGIVPLYGEQTTLPLLD